MRRGLLSGLAAVILVAAPMTTFVQTARADKGLPSTRDFPATQPLPTKEMLLKDGDFLALIGDSITEQRMYSAYVEDYILMCKPAKDVRVMQFGWGGETAKGFFDRIDNDCLQFKPTIVTTSFGMNDGGYTKILTERVATYTKATNDIVEAFKKANARIVLGTPGPVGKGDMANMISRDSDEYNTTLSNERDIVRETAVKHSTAFANVYDALMAAQVDAKAKYGQQYQLCGDDGIHPYSAGHLVMAYAYLKGLGVSGEIGTIIIDAAAKTATATDGHKIISDDGSAVTVESTKYPFCFFPYSSGWGAPPASKEMNSPTNPLSILEFVPFNQELNRFMLVVKNLPAGSSAKVTWGNASKTFSAEELAKGINLADAFLDNPFLEKFIEIDKLVHQKQEFETKMIKEYVHGTWKANPDAKKLNEDMADGCLKVQNALSDATAAAVKPLTHTIRIEVVK